MSSNSRKSKQSLEETREMLVKALNDPLKTHLELKDEADAYERKKRLEVLKLGPDLRDWRMVYNWELTKQGKTRFANTND